MFHSARSRQQLAIAFMIFWLGASAFGFWWFQFRYIQSYQQIAASFDGDVLENMHFDHAERPRVMHFLDDDCPCTRFAEVHVRDLEARYEEVADFLHADPLTLGQRVPATPAVAIWSKQGQLAYFGPYSSGAFCGEGDDFVQTTLERLQQEQNTEWISQDALGCFCRTQVPSAPV